MNRKKMKYFRLLSLTVVGGIDIEGGQEGIWMITVCVGKMCSERVESSGKCECEKASFFVLKNVMRLSIIETYFLV